MIKTLRNISNLLLIIWMCSALQGCSSGSGSQYAINGVWAVFVTTSQSTSTQANTLYQEICSCNQSYSSTASDIELDIWEIRQNGSSINIFDQTTGAAVANGYYISSTLVVSSVNGDWDLTAYVREDGCCFDGNGSLLQHWHGIKWANSSGGCQTGYDSWTNALLNELNSGSSLIGTASGEIEYAIDGDETPTILFFHGGQGGYDEIRTFLPGIFDRGFRVITWSRPGYLRTSLDVGKSPSEQADAAAALLDTLGIAKVGALGGSAGGPPVYEFALNYPEKLWAMVPVSAVNQTYAPQTADPSVAVISYVDLQLDARVCL